MIMIQEMVKGVTIDFRLMRTRLETIFHHLKETESLNFVVPDYEQEIELYKDRLLIWLLSGNGLLRLRSSQTLNVSKTLIIALLVVILLLCSLQCCFDLRVKYAPKRKSICLKREGTDTGL